MVFPQLWNDHCPTDNQIEIKLPAFKKSAADLLKVPVGQVSLAALEHNIAVATLFIEAWLKRKYSQHQPDALHKVKQGAKQVSFCIESGTFTFRGAVEDSATAEISRWQVWQWIYHRVRNGADGLTNYRLVIIQTSEKTSLNEILFDIIRYRWRMLATLGLLDNWSLI